MTIAMSNPTVLVTAIGSFSAQTVIDSLHGMGCRVVGCDIYPKEWVANTQLVDVFYQAPLVRDRDQYYEMIRRVVSDEHVDFIFPLTDLEVDALNAVRDSLGAMLCLSSSETLSICRDKYRTYDFLREVIPDSVIPTERLADCDIHALRYPVICKPVDGRSSCGLFKAFCEKELRQQLDHIDAGRYCVQPMINGTVVTVDVVRNDATGTTACVPRKELLRTLNGAGTSVYVFRDQELERMAHLIADKLRIHGCVNFEFIQNDDGSFHFLECNPRFSGGLSFTLDSGYDCVVNHLRCFTGQDIDEPKNIRVGYIARKYADYLM